MKIENMLSFITQILRKHTFITYIYEVIVTENFSIKVFINTIWLILFHEVVNVIDDSQLSIKLPILGSRVSRIISISVVPYFSGSNW